MRPTLRSREVCRQRENVREQKNSSDREPLRTEISMVGVPPSAMGGSKLRLRMPFAMMHPVLSCVLFLLLVVPASAQTGPPPGLSGVFLGGSGNSQLHSGAITQFNPEVDAVPVSLTPFYARIGAVTADTLDGRVRTPGGNGANRISKAPAMSASGRTVFVAQWFDGGHQIITQNRDGTDRTVIMPSTGGDYQGTTENLFPDISPDGETVIYVPTTGAVGQIGDNLYRIPSDGSGEAERILFDAPVEAVVRAVFSPDGSKVAALGSVSNGNVNSPATVASLIIADVDGSNAQTFFLDEPTRTSGWLAGTVSLDWKAGTILYTTPTFIPSLNPMPGPRIGLFDVEDEALVSRGSPGAYPYLLQLSPDARYIGRLVGATPAEGFTQIEVIPTNPDDEEAYPYRFGDAFPNGRVPIFHWADVPSVPEPARLEFENRGVLIWEGRSVALNPVLYDAESNVISRTIRTVDVVNGGPAAINTFTHELWGTNQNRFEREVCVENGGLRRCLTYNNVHTPVIDAVVLDDEIEEEGNDPGVLQIVRYGRPNTASIPVFEGRPRFAGAPTPALHYLDYTLSVLPERLRLPASDVLADTLQTVEIELAPIDDGVDEQTEAGRIYFDCFSGGGTIYGPDDENCQVAGFSLGSERWRIPGVPEGIGDGAAIRWDFEIVSNGAGSGLALASSSPAAIPSSGQATVTVNGQGIAEGATATLTGPATIEADHVASLQGGVQGRLRFVLDEAPPGEYDVTVTSGAETATLEGAVTVDAETPGGVTDVWATLQSRSGRIGLPRTQQIVYGNDGTADAALTPLLIAIPPGFEPEFPEPLYQLPDLPPGYDPEASPWRTVTASAADIPGLCFRPRAAAAGPRLTSVAGGDVICADGWAPTDSLDYQVAIVFLPTIPPGGRGTLEVAVTKLESGTLPWFVKIGAPFNTLEFEDESETLDQVTASAMVSTGPRAVRPVDLTGCAAPSAAFGKTAGTEALSRSRAAACAGCLGAVLGAIFERSPYGDCAKSAIGLLQATYQTFLDGAASGSGAAAASGVSVLTGLLDTAVSCGQIAFPVLSAASGLYAAMSLLNSGASFLSNAENCIKCFGLDGIWGVVGEVYSADPNDKLGPVAVGDAGYTRELGRMGYTIRFENLPSATAAAVEVIVTDTLDTSVYDLATFELGDVSIADHTFTPPSGLQTWTTFWDRRPEAPSVVRIHGALDRETGVVRWVISDLNPDDGYRLRTSEEAGFLPPNTEDGDGEGYARFTIQAKEGLPDGTLVANGATIRFDRNELITTPTWANTLDLTAPTSEAVAVEPFDADTSWVVRFEGGDAGSGIAGYDLYVQVEEGPFTFVNTARADSAVFRGEAGVSYGFFVTATDWVDNQEGPKTTAEVRVGPPVSTEPSGPSGPEALSLAAPYPNPTRGAAVVQVGLPETGRTRVAVYDVRGREVAVLLDEERSAGWHPIRWNAGSLAAGMYVVRAEAAGRVEIQRLTVVR